MGIFSYPLHINQHSMKNNFGIPISFGLFPVKETTEKIRPSSRQKQMKLL
jgi:hypothetical protein